MSLPRGYDWFRRRESGRTLSRLCRQAQARVAPLFAVGGMAIAFCAVAWTYPESSSAAEATGFELHFDWHAEDLVIGRTTLSLRPSARAAGGYVYESASKTVGVAALIHKDRIEERSEFQIQDGNVRSQRYRYVRAGGKKDRTVKVRFDWNRMEAHNTAKGKSWSMAVPTGTLDKLNYLLVLMRDLSVDVRSLSYPVADGGKLKTFKLEHIGQERIDTIFGPTDTVIMQRSRKNGRRVTTLWCARSLNFAPVQIEHRESDGNVVLLKLNAADGDVRFPR